MTNIKQEIKELNQIAREIAFSGFQNYSQKQFGKMLINIADIIEKKTE